jgi:hypothetical protein
MKMESLWVGIERMGEAIVSPVVYLHTQTPLGGLGFYIFYICKYVRIGYIIYVQKVQVTH